MGEIEGCGGGAALPIIGGPLIRQDGAELVSSSTANLERRAVSSVCGVLAHPKIQWTNFKFHT
jgi:hypothetical protein